MVKKVEAAQPAVEKRVKKPIKRRTKKVETPVVETVAVDETEFKCNPDEVTETPTCPSTEPTDCDPKVDVIFDLECQVNTLKDENASLENYNEKLKDDVKELKEDVQVLAADKQSLKTQLASMTTELNDIKNQRNQYKTSFENAKSRNQDLTKQLNDTKASRDEFSSKSVRLEKQVKDLEDKKDILESANEDLLHDYKQTKILAVTMSILFGACIVAGAIIAVLYM